MCPSPAAQEYDILILGISTWDFGELQEDWESGWEDIQDASSWRTHHRPVWHGRSAGLWGVVSGCPRPAARSAGPKGVKLVGYWPNEGYEFDASKALIDDGRPLRRLASMTPTSTTRPNPASSSGSTRY